jgi:hypothetical protein
MPNNEVLEGLWQLGHDYPTLWRRIDEYRHAHSGAWPGHVFLPMRGAAAILMGLLSEETRCMQPDQVSALMRKLTQEGLRADTVTIALLSAWRPAQLICRYDEALYDALIRTPVTGDIPADVLQRLPAWSVYLDTPGIGSVPAYDGSGPTEVFGALVTSSVSFNGKPSLIVMLNAHGATDTVEVELGGTIEESLAKAVYVRMDEDRHVAQLAKETSAEVTGKSQCLSRVLSLLLYLCVDEPDVDDAGRQYTLGRYPAAKHTKKGWRIFPPDKPTVVQVGAATGARLRAAHALRPTSGAKASPRSHIRQAHWHTYLVGPGRAERKLRWLHPMLVNAAEAVGQGPRALELVDELCLVPNGD